MKEIEVNNVSRKFTISEESNKDRNWLQKLRIRGNSKKTIWALKDVSFSVEKGERLGLIGENGSGKTTLLKIIGGILYPTRGEVKTKGNVTSVLSLGAGFNEDLSARENVYLYGSMMGLAKEEIEEKYQDIVSFSGLYDYMDTKFKKFSDGMKMRLAFSTAMSVNSDIFLSDEVFSVGDGNFQRKCLRRMKKLKDEGRTILLASHSLDLISEWCDRVLFLDEGRIKDIGKTREVVDKYRDFLVWKGTNEDFKKNNRVQADSLNNVEHFKLVDSSGKEKYVFEKGETFTIKARFDNEPELIRGLVRDKVSDSVKAVFLAQDFETKDSSFELSSEIGSLFLEQGEYYLELQNSEFKKLGSFDLKIQGEREIPDKVRLCYPEQRLEMDSKLFVLKNQEIDPVELDKDPLFAYKILPDDIDINFEEGAILRKGKVLEDNLSSEELKKKFKKDISMISRNKDLQKINEGKLTPDKFDIELKGALDLPYVFRQGGKFRCEFETTEEVEKGVIVFKRDGEEVMFIFSKNVCDREGKKVIIFESDSLYLEPHKFEISVRSGGQDLIKDLVIEVMEGKKRVKDYIVIREKLRSSDFPEGRFYVFGDTEGILERFEKGESVEVYSEDFVDLENLENKFGSSRVIENSEE